MSKHSVIASCFRNAAIALGSLLIAVSAQAQVKPGQVISPENQTLVKDLVSPGVYARISYGMRMDIVPTSRVDWPPPYKDATEKYSEQCRLGVDHRALIGYVAGQPFPLLDPNDPDVGAKIIWNNVFRPIQTDDYDLRFFDCEQVYPKLGGTQRVINRFDVGHYAGYNLIGRTEVEPIPVDPDFKVSNRLWMFAAYPLLAPEQSRGQGLIRYRYADPDRVTTPGPGSPAPAASAVSTNRSSAPMPEP